MAYSRYATEMKDGDNNIYGLMDEEARAQLSDLNSAISSIPGNLVSSAITATGVFINTSGELAVLAVGAERTICVKGEANRTYKIKKKTSTIMRAGCASTNSATAGTQLSSFAYHSSASSDELTVKTNGTNTYIYIQLFANSDSSELQTIDANISSLIVFENLPNELVKINTDSLSFKGSVRINSDLNDYQTTGLYLINLSNADYSTVSHTPPSSMYDTPTGSFLEVIHTSETPNDGIICQRIYNSYRNAIQVNNRIVRYGVLVGSTFTWYDWKIEQYSANEIDNIKNKSLSFKGHVSTNTDFNDYQTTGIYQLNLTDADYNTLLNKPPLSMLGSAVGRFLEVIHTSTIVNDGEICQRICNSYRSAKQKNSSVVRYGVLVGSTFTWYDWMVEYYSAEGTDENISMMSGGGISFEMNTTIKIKYNAKAGEKFAFIISSGSFSYTGLTNLYFEGYKNGTSVGYLYIMAKPTNANIGQLIVFDINYDIDTLILATNKGPNAVITAFEGILHFQQPYLAAEIEKVDHVFHVGANRTYTSLLEGVIAAERYKNSVVYVDPGTYDIVQEFKDKYGNDYFTSNNYTSQENFRGIPLTNGIHIIGYSGVTVTGGLQSTDSADAITWWSIFNAGDNAGGTNGYGFTLENITIKVTNQYIRYAVHDEYGGVDFDYINKYINCHFVIADGVNKACIGGGLGKHGYIVIDNCTIDAPTYLPTRTGIHYHNNVDDGSLSEIYITNCYIPNGTVGISWYGNTPSTEKSVMYINNCTLQYAPIKHGESSEYTNENVDIVAWRNTHLT